MPHTGRVSRSVRVALRPHRLAYLIPTLLAAVAVQTWFEPGTVIASGDLPPPVQPNTQYRSHWNQMVTGDGAPTYDIVILAYYEPLRVATATGVGEEAFQRLWLTALVAGSAAAVVFFAFGLSLRPFVAGAAGALIVLNASRLVSPGDWVGSATIIAAGVLGGLVLRAGLRERERPRALSFALASLGASVIFINPPLVYLVVVWVGASLALVAVLAGSRSLRAAASFLAKAAPLAVLLNAWWIVPAALTILGATFDTRFAAPGVDEWAWTHARSSLLNVLALNSTWAWDYPEYYPYADRLSRPPFDVFRYFLLALAAVGVLLARGRERRVALTLAVFGVIFTWLGKGLHPPLPSLSSWLYTNLPGYWLLREPGKILVLLAFVLAILAAIGIARLVSSDLVSPLVSRTLAVAFVAGAVVYVHPLFTGEVIPGKRAQFGSAHVRLPQAWVDAPRFLNSRPEEGKVLILPRADFYALPTRWGYYGASFARIPIERGVIEPLPGGGYFRTAESVSALVRSIERDLVSSDRRANVVPKLRALGARYILLRRDLEYRFPGRRLSNPGAIARGLAVAPGIRRVQSFGDLELYEVPGERAGEIFPAVPVSYGGLAASVPEALEVYPNTALREPTGGERVAPEARARISLSDAAIWQVAVKSAGRDVLVRFETLPGGRDSDRRRSRSYARFPAVRPPFVVVTGNESFAVPELRRRWTTIGALRGVRSAEVTLARIASPAGAPSATMPDVSYTRISPSEFRVRVLGASDPFLLVATEAHAPGWRIARDDGATGKAEHVVVNGYANGWVVPWRGTYELRVFYEPERTARLARRSSLVTVPAALLIWVGSMVAAARGRTSTWQALRARIPARRRRSG